MSHITVGYTDKARRIQAKGPAGSISDIFGFSDDSSRNNKQYGQIQKESDVTNKNNDHQESKICQITETLSIEANSNEVKNTVESTKIEVNQTQVKTSNGNDNEVMITKTTQTSAANNIIHKDEKDSGAPQMRNRVPPGGYSAGFW